MFCLICERVGDPVRTISTYNGQIYEVCSFCNTHNNVRREFLVDSDTSGCWNITVDPDGVIRNIADEYEFKIRNWYGSIPDFINKNFSDGKILDYGCGVGFLAGSLSKNHNVFAFDISPAAREQARCRFPDVVVLDSLNFDDLEGFFDVVICYHVIEHVVNPIETLRNLNRLLTDNGMLVVGTPNIFSLAAKKFKGRFRLYDQGHLTMIGDTQLAKVIVDAGFQVIKTEFPFFSTKYFTFKNVWRFLVGRGISPPFYGSIVTIFAKKS